MADNLPPTQPQIPPQPDQPEVQIIQKSFFQTKKGLTALAIGLAVIIFLILLITLNYFDVLSPAQLAAFPKRPPSNATSTAVRITLIPQNYGFRAGELTLSCPVDSAFCQSQKLVKVNQANAVVYKAASGSAVLDLNQVGSLDNMAVLTNQKTGKKYFYESTVSKDGKSCYTIAYTLASDATFANLLDLQSFLQNNRIATLGQETFEIEGQTANVLIQVRNSPMDPETPCSLIRKSPEFFKAFD